MQKYLFVKIAALGDVIMSLQILSFFKIQKNAQLVWVCGEAVAPLLKLFKNIEVITVNEQNLFKGNLISIINEFIKLSKKLIIIKFHSVIIGNRDLRYRLLVLFALTKKTVQFGKSNSNYKFATGNFHGIEYAKLFFQNIDGKSLHIKYPNIPKSLLGNPHPDVLKLASPIILCPGGAKGILHDDWQRRWPVANYVLLAQQLIKYGHNPVIIGTKEDKWVEKYFDNVSITNLIGKTNLLSCLSTIKHSRLVIAHDSGPFHMSILVGTKIIGLFGPTNPQERIPHCFNGVIIKGRINLLCRPCYDGKKYGLCAKNLCMTEIHVENVFKEINRLLNKD